MDAARGLLNLAAGKDALGHRGTAFAKMEDEVKVAEMESRLRELVCELVKPTVLRTCRVQSDVEELREQLKIQGEELRHAAADIASTKERSDSVVMFKVQLEELAVHLREADSRLLAHERTMSERVDGLEQRNDTQASFNLRTDRVVDRLLQDLELANAEQKRLAIQVDRGFVHTREFIAAEVATTKLSIKDLQIELQTRFDEIWGSTEDLSEISPPSMRRFDLQLRKLTTALASAVADLAILRKLDAQMAEVTKREGDVDVQLKDFIAKVQVLRERIEKIDIDVKQEAKLAANRMAAFTASLMKDARSGFNDEVKSFLQTQRDVQSFMSTTQAFVDGLEHNVKSIALQVDANLRELHHDLDTLEAKRRRDKQLLEDSFTAVRGRMEAAVDASTATLKGLEHVSNVVGMSLQSERMSVALDVQDFVDRKDTPYVGLRGEKACHRGARSTELRRKEGLDPNVLTRLVYAPSPISFQGTAFDRSQLLALRERLVNVAQDVLLQGPCLKGQKKGLPFEGGESSPLGLLPQALGAGAELPTVGRRPMPPVARPGSRGQPSARGSPMSLEGSSVPTPLTAR